MRFAGRIAGGAILPALLLISGAGAQETASALPAWIAGGWTGAQGDEWVEEYWTPPRAGLMLGGGRAGKGETLSSWEAMRIARSANGMLTFYAMPEGKAAVAFPMVDQSERSITFQNSRHDYPQRIRYWREGDRLMAEISLADGSQVKSWSYTRAGE
ncbi:hypothetical protein KFK14_13350 [Sphingobium phenoxybenzoativorans]|uniref:DUF6265 domain-containing protein n=1 Tax=Sphingobium phenoxybenzoativorans TaxID=1592790 RepID=A0A975K4T5_9SPHN|nr:DUF6265 family protein [Sphingobium phenoxybenzoativorans]QUT04128.1 hypothetical protein KFK14_13350 [Sphingobium phenoxybenzoativorans]